LKSYAVGGGAIPYKILNALPDNTRMVIYGSLDQSPTEFSPRNILFKQNTIEGYWLSKETQKKSILEVILDVRKIQKMLSKGFETQIQKKVKLSELQTGLETYVKGMSAGKVLIDCDFGSAQ
jgi:NADPH:quinone reductase